MFDSQLKKLVPPGKDGTGTAILIVIGWVLAAAELMLADNDAESALKALRRTVCPRGMERAEALLETRALVALGLRDEGARRWRRYVNSTVSDRKWVK